MNEDPKGKIGRLRKAGSGEEPGGCPVPFRSKGFTTGWPRRTDTGQFQPWRGDFGLANPTAPLRLLLLNELPDFLRFGAVPEIVRRAELGSV